jgi:hypothetical protein
MQVYDLPRLNPRERGGPRYAQMESPQRQSCAGCTRELPPGELHVYDRVRAFGKPPRRYCATCWEVVLGGQQVVR